MRQHPLLVAPDQRLNAKRTPLRSQPNASRPHEWWGIDMTTVLVQGFGWIDMGVVRERTRTAEGLGLTAWPCPCALINALEVWIVHDHKP